MKNGLLNLQQVCWIDDAHIVISLSRGVFAVEWKMEPAKRDCVEHVSFHPVKSCVVWGWKHRCYMKLEVIWANWFWLRGAQRNHRAKPSSFSQARRYDHSRTTFDHFWRNESGEVTDNNGALFRVKLNSHDLFYRHKSDAAMRKAPNVELTGAPLFGASG